jgi:hypothetical protein
MRKILAIAALLMSTFALADDRVTVSGIHAGKAPEGFIAVMGTAHNNTNAQLGSVFVKFKLYDAAGNVIGNTVAHAADIGPGENWKFSAPTTAPFAQAKLSSIDIY